MIACSIHSTSFLKSAQHFNVAMASFSSDSKKFKLTNTVYIQYEVIELQCTCTTYILHVAM